MANLTALRFLGTTDHPPDGLIDDVGGGANDIRGAAVLDDHGGQHGQDDQVKFVGDTIQGGIKSVEAERVPELNLAKLRPS